MMRCLLLLIVLVGGCSKTENSELPIFDFQGLRLGDEIPERLKNLKNSLKEGHLEFIDDKVGDKDMKVHYIALHGRIEAITIEYKNTSNAIEVYTKKLGSKPVVKNRKAAWATLDGTFVIDLSKNTGEIASKKAIDEGNALHQENIDELSKKL